MERDSGEAKQSNSDQRNILILKHLSGFQISNDFVFSEVNKFVEDKCTR